MSSRFAGVDVVAKGPGVVEIAWAAGTGPDVVRPAAEELLASTAARVEAYLATDDVAAHRVAARSGLRREGLLRGVRGESPAGDRLLFARLAGDPAPDSREGFSAVLDTTMPAKRVIAQGLLRDAAGRVLLCETTYKRDWDLPGGIVDPDEAPRHTVARELHEELGLDVAVGRLLVVAWLPRYLGWSDAVLHVHDLGIAPEGLVERMTLSQHEIRAVHWVDEPDRCAPYERAVIAAARAVADDPAAPPAELEAPGRD